jgi:hypothetical protein
MEILYCEALSSCFIDRQIENIGVKYTKEFLTAIAYSNNLGRPVRTTDNYHFAIAFEPGTIVLTNIGQAYPLSVLFTI